MLAAAATRGPELDCRPPTESGRWRPGHSLVSAGSQHDSRRLNGLRRFSERYPDRSSRRLEARRAAGASAGSVSPRRCGARPGHPSRRSTTMPHPERVPGGRTVRRRDRGLRRVRLTTVAVAVGAVAGSVVMGAGYAQSLPGAAVGPAPRAASPSTGADPASAAPSTPSMAPTTAPAPTEPSTSPAPARPQAPTPARTQSSIPTSRAPQPAPAPTRQAPAPQPPALQPPAQPPAPVVQPPQPPPTKSGAS